MSSAYPILLWWAWECVLYLIIIIEPEVWTINLCLGLGHETMVCAVCLTMFLSERNTFRPHLACRTSSKILLKILMLHRYLPLQILCYHEMYTNLLSMVIEAVISWSAPWYWTESCQISGRYVKALKSGKSGNGIWKHFRWHLFNTNCVKICSSVQKGCPKSISSHKSHNASNFLQCTIL